MRLGSFYKKKKNLFFRKGEGRRNSTNAAIEPFFFYVFLAYSFPCKQPPKCNIPRGGSEPQGVFSLMSLIALLFLFMMTQLTTRPVEDKKNTFLCFFPFFFLQQERT